MTSIGIKAPSANLRDALALVGALLFVHAFLVLNDGLFADEWLMLRLAPDYPVETDFLIHGAGHPFMFGYVTLANLSGHPIAFMKALAIAAIIIGALNLRSLLLRLNVFSDFEAAMFAFLVWSYAGYQNWATKLLATYLFSFALLCLGLNLLSTLANCERQRIWLRVTALAVVFSSFSLNSMISAYGLGLFAIFLMQRRSIETRPSQLLLQLTRAITRFPDFVALPVFYWILVNHFFPKIGPYKAYYMPRLPDMGELAAGMNAFWIFGFRKVIRQGLELMRDSHIVLVAALLFAMALVMLLARNRSIRAAVLSSSALAIAWPLLAAIAIFPVCAVPYLASGLQPDGHFFGSRHLILCGIPNALLLVFFLRLVGALRIPRLAAYGLIATVMAVGLSALWSGYFNQQSRWLRLIALMDNIRSAYPEPPATVFNLSDGFLDNPWHTYFGTSELTGALHLIWGPRPFLGFTRSHERASILREIDGALHTEGSAVRNIDPWGPQATIIFTPTTPVSTNYELARNYYACLLSVCDRKAMTDKIATVDITVGPIANIEPRATIRE